VVAIAARDRSRAAAFAARHGIDRVLASYAEVIGDPAVHAVYIPLPNGLHAGAAAAALRAGKAVLCEKPLTANAAEAEALAAVARAMPLLLLLLAAAAAAAAAAARARVDRPPPRALLTAAARAAPS
jgi:predicted dehydrogenase